MLVTDETKARAAQAYDFLSKHPESHDQNQWVRPEDTSHVPDEKPDAKNMCSTTMCVAGTVVAFQEGVKTAWNLFADNESEGEKYAAELLGLTDHEAVELFYNLDNEFALLALERLAEGDEDGFWQVSSDWEDSLNYDD